MPKRTNDFQSLVALIERLVQPAGFVVTESAEVRDRSTGELREVDVLIEGEVGGVPITMAVEVVDHGRPASVEWIDRMAGKYLLRTLPVDKVVGVSGSGFTKAAFTKAEQFNIQTLSFGQAVRNDWTRELDELTTLRTQHTFLPYVEHIDMKLTYVDSAPAFAGVNPFDLDLEDANGMITGRVLAEVERVLESQQLIDVLSNEADEILNLRCELAVIFNPPRFIRDPAGARHQLDGMAVTARARRIAVAIPMQRASFGGHQVATGTAEVFGLPFRTAMVQQPGKPVTVGSSLGKPKTKSKQPKRTGPPPPPSGEPFKRMILRTTELRRHPIFEQEDKRHTERGQATEASSPSNVGDSELGL